jgi:hypothetical protein
MPIQVSLTFEGSKNARPVAVVSGGEYDREVLYVEDGAGKETKQGGKKPPKELPFGALKLARLPVRKEAEVYRAMSEAYARGIPPEHFQSIYPGAMTAYNDLYNEGNQKHETSITLPPNCSFQLLPSKEPEKREIWYIAGASGSGKSYIAKGLAEKYNKQFPERDMYLVSKLNEDSTLDSIKGKKLVRLNVAKLIDEPLKDLEPLRDCLIIFDDYDAFTGKEGKAVQQLIDDIATMGRHTGTTMLCLTHYLSNYKKTRLLLTEASHFVLYPQSTGAHALSYLLKTYLGMSPEEVSRLRKGGSRWVCIHKNMPIYAITETEAWLMNQE